MIYKLLSFGVLLAGITLTFNNTAIKANDLLASARTSIGQTNISQLRTALDLYYIDHGQYPDTNGGSAMINELEKGNYITENSNLDFNQFNYRAENNGQNYSLELN